MGISFAESAAPAICPQNQLSAEKTLFGYIKPNIPELRVREKARYDAWYCGLCRRLGARYGTAARALLSFDCTFLAAARCLRQRRRIRLKICCTARSSPSAKSGQCSVRLPPPSILQPMSALFFPNSSFRTILRTESRCELPQNSPCFAHSKKHVCAGRRLCSGKKAYAGAWPPLKHLIAAVELFPAAKPRRTIQRRNCVLKRCVRKRCVRRIFPQIFSGKCCAMCLRRHPFPKRKSPR